MKLSPAVKAKLRNIPPSPEDTLLAYTARKIYGQFCRGILTADEMYGALFGLLTEDEVRYAARQAKEPTPENLQPCPECGGTWQPHPRAGRGLALYHSFDCIGS